MDKVPDIMASQQQADEFLPLKPLHLAAERSGAYLYIDERRERLTRIYLTTEANMSDLRVIAGVSSIETVRYLLTTSLETLFEHLPQDIQERYKSAKEALQLKTRTQSRYSRQRISDALSKKYAGTFSQTHKEHLSEAAAKRWQRDREARQASGTPDQP